MSYCECGACHEADSRDTSDTSDLLRDAAALLAEASIILDGVAGSMFRSGDSGRIARSGQIDGIGIQLDRFIKDLRETASLLNGFS